jgi:RHS repeat-associated protein
VGGTATAHTYRVVFNSADRGTLGIDTTFDGATNHMWTAPHETRWLDWIDVQSKPSGTWQEVSRYDLTYNNSAPVVSDASNCSGTPLVCTPEGTAKLTLWKIQRQDNGGPSGTTFTGLPLTVFTYGCVAGTAGCPTNNARGTDYYARGDWNRLTKADNGQGGTVTFTYDNIGGVANPPISIMKNNRRVTSRTLTDGQGHSYPWSYSYSTPAYNSLGTLLGEAGMNGYPNSAVLYFNEKFDPNHSYLSKLARARYNDFRGHSYVVATDPNNNQTEHWFYQGDVGCYPQNSQGGPLTGEAIMTNACFLDLRRQEFLKGKEYHTLTHAGSTSGPKLSEVQHSFTVNVLNGGYDAYSDDRLFGLWRAFVFENQMVETSWDSGATPLTKTTNYTYDVNTYGNLTLQQESDAGGMLRKTQYTYATRNDSGTYIVDRTSSTAILDGQNRYLALTIYAYDNLIAPIPFGYLGTTGNLQLVRKFFDVPLATSLTGQILHGSDMYYGYDSYGNQTVLANYGAAGQPPSYTGAGTGTWTGSTWTLGAVGGGCTCARITTTRYNDGPFHAFRTQVDPPTVNGVTLTEIANYDYRMGTLTSVTDPNLNVTTAEYDTFGRMSKLIKPGDNSTYPTVKATYYDTEVPFRYLIEKRETANGAARRVQTYYDGMGRLIQTKSESGRDTSRNGTQNIVVDKRYDGLGQVTQESQPRYVSQSGSAFWAYTAPGTNLYNPTLTSYDGLGRPTQVQAPDTTLTSLAYSIAEGYRTATTTDARYHRTVQQSDVFGRLRVVQEDSGNNNQGPEPGEGGYLLYATTTYAYSPLDLLTQVADNAGNLTTMSYDSLGRKTSMHDPDMAPSGVNWTYQYDVNGNLLQQMDAKGQTTSFGYDALDRLISRNSNGSLATYTYDGAGVPNGKGQRTAMSLGGASTAWQYDSRGRTTRADYSVLTLATQTFQWTYDSADRITQITYPSSVAFPSGEQVTYEYDPAWRPTRLHSVHYLVDYVSNPHYTALDQPQDWTLGNGLRQTWQYDSVMARLARLQVGTAGSPASLSDRGYTYDAAGNVKTITRYSGGSPTETQIYSYDHRDRLTSWSIPGVGTDTYAYNTLGNLTSKAGVGYSYGPRALGLGGGGPHAVITVGGIGLTYDANGNMLSGPSLPDGSLRTYAWNADNQPTSITSGGAVEQYMYDADGERVTRVRNSVATYYIGGLVEVDQPSGVRRTSYTFNGQVVATREEGNEWWTNLTGVAASGNTLTKTAGSTGWDSGAISVATISAGTGIGYAEATGDSTVGSKMFGLGSGDSSASYDDIEFAWELQDGGGTRIYENGKLQVDQPTSYVPGTVFRVAVEYDLNQDRYVVRWYKNGAVIWTETHPTLSYPLVLDTSIYTPGARVAHAYLVPTGGASGPQSGKPGTSPNPALPAGSKGAGAPAAPLFVNSLTYLHADHLGSVSLATNSAGQVVSQQEFDPWGKTRSGNVPETTLNYTGQRQDGTGLLYYHSRYYDPALARFTSADSIVPGTAMGSGGAADTLGPDSQLSLRLLTVDFHEVGFVAGLNQENAFTRQAGFYFQLGDGDRSKSKNPMGPTEPQALNRYSYALDNPLRYTDPSGHVAYLTRAHAAKLVSILHQGAKEMRESLSQPGKQNWVLKTMVNAIIGILSAGIGETVFAGEAAAQVASRIGSAGVFAALQSIFDPVTAMAEGLANIFDDLGNSISTVLSHQNDGGTCNGENSAAVGIAWDEGGFEVADVYNGRMYSDAKIGTGLLSWAFVGWASHGWGYDGDTGDTSASRAYVLVRGAVYKSGYNGWR